MYEIKITTPSPSPSPSSSSSSSAPDDEGVENAEILQALFNEGMQQLYGFNQIEARRNFEVAIEVSNHMCIMCYWGLSVAFSPNINTALSEDAYMKSRNAIIKANNLIRSGSTSNNNMCSQVYCNDLIQVTPIDIVSSTSFTFMEAPMYIFAPYHSQMLQHDIYNL